MSGLNGMLGVAVNSAAIIAGSLFGIVFKHLISEAVSKSMQIALGVLSIVVGLKMALRFENVLLVVGCLAGGGALGTVWQVERRIEQLGEWVKKRVASRGNSQFALGFSIASILFCVGAMGVIGSIDSGIRGNHEVLFAKASIDGVISITFAAIYGIGVAFSAVSVFVYQGAIVLLAPQVHVLADPSVINNISGVGGMLVMMIGLSISGIRKIPVGDYFPAIFLVMLIAPLFR